MDHNFIRIDDSETKQLTLFQRDNNLDRMDNLDELPQRAAIFAICGKVNGQPANPRHIALTTNLQEQIKKLFSESNHQDDTCLKEFILSIKTKHLIYKLIQDDISSAPALDLKKNWEMLYRPECNAELNKIH